MRVLHILDHSLPLQSGYVFRTVGLLAAQRAMGWETVQMTTPKQTGAERPVEEVDGWTFHRTAAPRGPLAGVPILGELALMRATARRMDALVREVRPDIIQAHSPVLNGLPALRVGRRHGIPVVYEMRASWEDAAVDHQTARAWGLRYRASRAAETYVLRRADAITTICKGLKAEIVTRGIPPEKVTVVPNAVDLEAFGGERQRDVELAARLGLDGAKMLGFVGSFYGYEGLDLLLRALPRIRAQRGDVRALLVGGGPQEEALKELAHSLGLGEAAIFTGRVPHGEVQRYYDLIDVLVYPRKPIRLTELVTPLKPLEAMAQSRIVVASDVGGHLELIDDGRTGYLFKAGDAEALAGRVIDVLSRQQEWPALRAEGRRFIERERTWEISAARYAPVFEELASRSSPQGDRLAGG